MDIIIIYSKTCIYNGLLLSLLFSFIFFPEHWKAVFPIIYCGKFGNTVQRFPKNELIL